MRTLFTFGTTIVVALSAVALAQAGGGKGGSSQSSHSSHGVQSSHYTPSKQTGSYFSKPNLNVKTSSFKNYHLTHGKKFSKGYYYPGKYHNHWSFCCFNQKCGCYCYWCPWTTCWYYYCVPDCCYYPVCYVPYGCYCWGTPVAYCTAPLPPVDLPVPEPVVTLGPDAP